MSYNNYLQSKHWRSTRLQRIKRAGFRCQICGIKDVLFTVHHKRYKDKYGDSILGRETMNELANLCKVCHNKLHRYNLEENLNSQLLLNKKARRWFLSLKPEQKWYRDKLIGNYIKHHKREIRAVEKEVAEIDSFISRI